MRNLVLALVAGATLGASGVAAVAMPMASVPGAATGAAHIVKAAVVVRRTTVIRRPARRVCTTRMGGGRRVTVCR